MRLALVLITASAVCGCSSWQPVEEMAVVDASRVKLEVADDGPWSERGDPGVGGVWRVANDRFEDPASVDLAALEPKAPEPEPEPAPVIVPRAPEPRKMAVPKRRDPKKLKPRGTKLTKSPEQVAREHYLTNPTTIEAGRITLYVPPGYLPEVRLTGAKVEDLAANRRRATGNARLVVRELTLKADQITLRTLKADARDIRITARGEAGIITKVRDQVIREEGLRSLLISNDRLTPLR